MRYVYFDVASFLAPHLPPDAVAALLAACRSSANEAAAEEAAQLAAAVEEAAQLAAAAAATLSMSDSESDEGEAPLYQVNQWSLLPSLQAQLMVLDGADQRALQEASSLMQVWPATCLQHACAGAWLTDTSMCGAMLTCSSCCIRGRWLHTAPCWPIACLCACLASAPARMN